MKSKLYLIHNIDGLSLVRAGGPFTGRAKLELALIQLFSRTPGLQQDGADTAHTLEITPHGQPKFLDFSGGYMENARWAARTGASQEKPPTWENPAFAPATRETWETCRKKTAGEKFRPRIGRQSVRR